MTRITVFSGDTYGRLTVLRRLENSPRGKPVFECRCECGNIRSVTSGSLRSGNTKSCGCLQRDISKEWAPKMSRAFWRKAPGESAKRGAFACTRQSARKRGLCFTLTLEQFVKLAEQPCRYCGGSASNLYRSAGGDWKWNGLDRVDSSDGYTISNVVPCCKWCNQAKSGRTVDEFNEWIGRLFHNLKP